MTPTLGRRLVAEFLGTAFLLAAVVGSGVAAERLSPGNIGLQLLENSIATGAVLVALILTFGPVSGGHFNPVVTLAERVFGGMSTRDASAYTAAQVLGGAAGSIAANLMFGLSAVAISSKARSGPGLWLGEVIATLGLLLVIFGVVRSARPHAVPYAVAGYIAAAYWFTSSTSFANPAATLARTLSDSFAGIAPPSVPGFLIGELVGAALALATIAGLFPNVRQVASQVVLPHPASPAQKPGPPHQEVHP